LKLRTNGDHTGRGFLLWRAVFFLGLAVSGVFYAGLAVEAGKSESEFVTVLLVAGILLPHLWILLGTARNPPLGTNLVLAQFVSAANLVLAAYIVLDIARDHPSGPTARALTFLALSVGPALMLRGAWKLRLWAGRETTRGRNAAAAALAGILYLTSVARSLPVPEPEPDARTNELAAAGALQVFNAAAYEYLAYYHNGYPPSPAALGPPAQRDAEPSCNAAGILEASFLAEVRNGYRFEYHPGPPISDPPPGCIPGVENYTFSARPARYGRTGSVSYVTDETTTIYSTTHNHAATDRDPRFEP
jgi:hypothetical protein